MSSRSPSGARLPACARYVQQRTWHMYAHACPQAQGMFRLWYLAEDAMHNMRTWHMYVQDMFRLWYLAEDDLLRASNGYEQRDTGQGLHRVQNAPRTSRAMHQLLHSTQVGAPALTRPPSPIHTHCPCTHCPCTHCPCTHCPCTPRQSRMRNPRVPSNAICARHLCICICTSICVRIHVCICCLCARAIYACATCACAMHACATCEYVYHLRIGATDQQRRMGWILSHPFGRLKCAQCSHVH